MNIRGRTCPLQFWVLTDQFENLIYKLASSFLRKKEVAKRIQPKSSLTCFRMLHCPKARILSIHFMVDLATSPTHVLNDSGFQDHFYPKRLFCSAIYKIGITFSTCCQRKP